MIPPMTMRLTIYEKGQRKIHLWLPLFLLYILLLPFILILIPFVLLIGFGMWLFGMGRNPVAVLAWIYELWCATRGTIIETQSKADRVLIHIL